jgi:hypothetical protein
MYKGFDKNEGTVELVGGEEEGEVGLIIIIITIITI